MNIIAKEVCFDKNRSSFSLSKFASNFLPLAGALCLRKWGEMHSGNSVLNHHLSNPVKKLVKNQTCLRIFWSSAPSSCVSLITFSLSRENLKSFSLVSVNFWLRIFRRSFRWEICSSRSWTCRLNSASRSRILEVTVDPRRFSRLNLEGTPGNSRGGAELARGGGFSCNQTIFEIRIRWVIQ